MSAYGVPTYFIVGSNIPGCLPEDEDPRVFHAVFDARAALAEEMRGDAERCYESITAEIPSDVTEDMESIAASLERSAGILMGAAHEGDPLDPSGRFVDVLRDSTGSERAYWIEPRTMAQLLRDGTLYEGKAAAELAYDGLSDSDPEIAALIDPDMADPVALSGLIRRLQDLRDAIAAQYAAPGEES